MDYFDRVQAQLATLTRAGAHTGLGAVLARRLGRARPLVPVLASLVLVLVVGAALLSTRGSEPSSGGRPVARPAGRSGHPPAIPRTPTQPILIGPRGLAVPATYGSACTQAGNPCPPSTPVPLALRERPLDLRLLRGAGPCPTSGGTRVENSLIGGIALGGAKDTVRPLIANAGDLRHGRARLGTTDVPGWGAVKIVWFSLPGYQGPFVIRALALRASAPARIGDPGGLPASAPILVPPGATSNTGVTGSGAGYRTLPSALWVRRPGCYGLQVDGLSFTDDYVLRVTG